MSKGLRSFSAQERTAIAHQRVGGKGLGALAAKDYIDGPRTDLVGVRAKTSKKLQKRIAFWQRYKSSPEGSHEHKCPGSNK